MGTALEVVKMEEGLLPLQTVEARWTNNHQYFKADALVLRVNKSSIRVKLLHDVTCCGWYVPPGETFLKAKWRSGRPYLKAGHEMTLPRALTTKWSSNNGVFALPEEQ